MSRPSRRPSKRPKVSIRPPPKESTEMPKVGPGDETHVPCPVCRKGTVPAAVAAAVVRALEKEG